MRKQNDDDDDDDDEGKAHGLQSLSPLKTSIICLKFLTPAHFHSVPHARVSV